MLFRSHNDAVQDKNTLSLTRKHLRKTQIQKHPLSSSPCPCPASARLLPNCLSAPPTRSCGLLSCRRTSPGTTSTSCWPRSSWWACVCSCSSARSTPPSSGTVPSHARSLRRHHATHTHTTRLVSAIGRNTFSVCF